MFLITAHIILSSSDKTFLLHNDMQYQNTVNSELCGARLKITILHATAMACFIVIRFSAIV